MSSKTKILILALAAGLFVLLLVILSTSYFTRKSASNSQPASQSPASSPAAETASELVSLDDTWNLYTNHRLGFSLKVPKYSIGHKAGCAWDNNSYHRKYAIVPITVIDDANGAYIVPAFEFQLLGENVDSSGRSSYSDCRRVDTTLSSLQLESSRRNWHFIADTVANDEELTRFIQSRFGSACSIGSTQPDPHNPGTYRINVKGDDKDPGESECFINYVYDIRYTPGRHQIIAWNYGQNISFFDDQGNFFDGIMQDSFRIIDISK